MKKYLPYALFVIGVALVVGVVWYSLHTSQPVPTTSSGMGSGPEILSGLPQTELVTGQDAIQEIQNLHIGDFGMQQGMVAVYGEQNVLLWVADAGSVDEAATLVEQMAAVIVQGTTPFNPTGIYDFSNRKVYGMDGMGQLHFFFQSGQQVVWISADPTAAEQALIDAMTFYP